MRKPIFILLLLAALLFPALPILAEPEPAELSAVTPWPQKADWVGQQAAIIPAKLNASASYLLVFPKPGQDISGVDQLFLARKYIGQSFTIEGLYQQQTKRAAAYYWRLVGPEGSTVWVRDYPAGQLSALPFALPSEFDAENKVIAELTSLAGTTVWINRNLITASELSTDVGHLEPLTITAFKSNGPFSDTYSLAFRQANGEPVVWELKPAGKRAAFSTSQFYALVQQDLYRQDPQDQFPLWADIWPLIKAREIRVGWDREMVLMSWGTPTSVEKVLKGPEKGLERWGYGSNHLYFEGKQLAKIKIPDSAGKDKNSDDENSENDITKSPDPKKPEQLIEVTGAKKRDSY